MAELIDRDKFFAAVRADPFGGNLTQLQVDGLNEILDAWETHFRDSDIRWLAYALATTFHETAETFQPIEEYGEGSDHDYGQPTGVHNQCYFGRGFVQLTWEANYEKGEQILRDKYGVECPMHRYPSRMLEHMPAALILLDGSVAGWFTGVGLPQYFNETTEDSYNARRVINGTDQAEKIAGYYESFKKGLQ